MDEYRCPYCGEYLIELIPNSKYFCTSCDKFFNEDGDEIDAEDEDMMDDVPWKSDL